MPTLALAEAGLSLLEENASQPPYEHYWTETFLPVVARTGQLTDDGRTRIERTAEFIQCVSSSLFRERDLAPLAAFPEYVPDETFLNERAVLERWSNYLGNFNALVGSQPDLLAAAAILLESSEGISEEVGYRRSAVKLRAGLLTHMAAWVETDTDKRQDLLQTAADSYQDLLQLERISFGSRRQAHNHLYDIKFFQAYDASEAENLIQEDATWLHEKYLLKNGYSFNAAVCYLKMS